MTDISQKVAYIQARVLKEEYYPHLWVRSLAHHGASTASIDQHEHTDSELVRLCNTFWNLLPDSQEIRTGPFFTLCSVAEHLFDEE